MSVDVGDRAAVAAVIRACRFRYDDEDSLQEGIAAALVAAGHAVEREHRLDARSRLDLFVDGWLGIEVKIGSSAPMVKRQIDRYLEHGLDLIVVTSRSQHVRLASDRVEVICVNGSGL